MLCLPGRQRLRLLWLCSAICLLGLLVYPARSQTRGVNVKAKDNAESRIALVIGNANYAESPLLNPVNDARSMAVALHDCGFQVVVLENATRAEMLRAIESFRAQLNPNAVALFYFAGHGVQVKGENYLIPIGAAIKRELDVEIEGVHLLRVLNEMQDAKARVNLVILDACRNNPFPRSSRSGANGLSEVKAPSGTLIAYATAPDSTASDGEQANGLYTQELLAAIRTPGIMIEQVFKRVRVQVEFKSGGQQIPWEKSSLKGDFYFVAGEAPVAVTPTTAETSLVPPSSAPSPINRNAGRWVVVADQTITVPTNQAWKDTQIQIKPNQDVRLFVGASEINLGALGLSAPGGTAKSDKRKPAAACETGAVIARIGQEFICVNGGRTFTATTSGTLLLGLNESNVADNRNTFAVKVLVQEFRP